MEPNGERTGPDPSPSAQIEERFLALRHKTLDLAAPGLKNLDGKPTPGFVVLGFVVVVDACH